MKRIECWNHIEQPRKKYQIGKRQAMTVYMDSDF